MCCERGSGGALEALDEVGLRRDVDKGVGGALPLLVHVRHDARLPVLSDELRGGAWGALVGQAHTRVGASQAPETYSSKCWRAEQGWGEGQVLGGAAQGLALQGVLEYARAVHS